MNYSRGDAVLRKDKPENKGLSHGAMDKLGRRVERLLKNKVPRELWTKGELAYEAFELQGLACPSSNALDSVQVTEKRKEK